MNELSLFTGAGGGLLGTLLLGWKPIGYVEFNKYCQQVIRARIDDGILPVAPIFTDVCQFIQSGAAQQYRGFADVVTAGFPCQPFSNAGKRRGAADERNMWPATIECIRLVRPKYAFLENVPGLLTSGYFGTVLGDLAAAGYDARWLVLSAADCGAPHERERLWIRADAQSERTRGLSVRSREPRQASTDADRLGEDVSNASGNGRGKRENQPQRQPERGGTPNIGNDGKAKQLAYTDNARLAQRESVSGHNGKEFQTAKRGGNVAHAEQSANRPEKISSETDGPHAARSTGGTGRSSWWEVEPRLDRVANGVAHRVDRLKALGNGQVSIVAATAWRMLSEGLSV